MIAAAILCAVVLLGQAPGLSEDCGGDADALAREAETLLAETGPRPSAATLELARRLYRRARLLSPSAPFSLRAADLASAAGDEEESGDLLSEAAESNAKLISPTERLILARRAEAQRQWRDAIAHYGLLRSAVAPDTGAIGWVDAKIRRLEVEVEAQGISAPSAGQAPPEARLALAEGRRALAVGDLPKARERLTLAWKLSPGYVEAALALAALETRESRAPEAIRAYRDALAADPARLEALVGLANVLWDEPDRAAKEESLSLLDRAVAARPDAISLGKLAATRWAEWGDAAKALNRIDAYRRRAGAEERRATENFRETLARRVDAQLSGEAVTAEPSPSEASSPAIDQWKIAQAYFRRGDPASLGSALEHLGEAERLDPAFARAPELAGAVYEKRGELALAQAAYERALLADSSRAATYERLALLLDRQPGRGAEAEEAWRRAEQAGSTEALFHLAETERRRGRRGGALSLYRRYLAESPGGVHTEDVSRAVAALESSRRVSIVAAGVALLFAVLAAGTLGYRRVGGRTFEEWLREEPARAREARPIVGRLRHEVVKHGGLLLEDAANRLSEPDPEVRRATARLLLTRLFGLRESEGRGGLIRESSDAFARLSALAEKDGHRLNLERKDRLFSPIAQGCRVLRGLEPALSHIAEDPEKVDESALRHVAESLRRAAALFGSNSGAQIARLLDEASSTRVRLSELQDVLVRVCAEKGFAPPPVLQPLGELLRDPSRSIAVRVDRGDWDTIWRNLLANALDAAGALPISEVRLGVSAEPLRDLVTGAPCVRFILADNLPGALTAEMIRGRAADRGWGIVADLVRRHAGTADVVPAPAPGYGKGVVLEVPALEPEGSA